MNETQQRWAQANAEALLGARYRFYTLGAVARAKYSALTAQMQAEREPARLAF